MSDESCEVTKKSGSRLNHGWCATQVERVKLLFQNQGKMLWLGTMWCGNQDNVIRYFPTQILSLFLFVA